MMLLEELEDWLFKFHVPRLYKKEIPCCCHRHGISIRCSKVLCQNTFMHGHERFIDGPRL
jgi:hypothetical protein